MKRARSSRFSASGRRSGATSAADVAFGRAGKVQHRAAVADLRAPFGDQPQRQRIELVLGLEHARGQRVLVSPASTGTAACAMIGPSSTSAVTKCTVQPWMRTPASSARACVSRPLKDGSSEGWMLISRP